MNLKKKVIVITTVNLPIHFRWLTLLRDSNRCRRLQKNIPKQAKIPGSSARRVAKVIHRPSVKSSNVPNEPQN